MDAFTVSGVEEIRARLRALPAKVQRRVIRPALRDAAKVVLAAAKTEVPVDTGLLQRSLKVRAQKRTRKGTIGMNVMGGSDRSGPAYYGSFVEFGTRNMRPQRFMQRAYSRTAQQANQKAMVAIAAGIEREAAAR